VSDGASPSHKGEGGGGGAGSPPLNLPLQHRTCETERRTDAA